MMKKENGQFQVARGIMHTAGNGLAGDTDRSFIINRKGVHSPDAGRFSVAFILLVKYKARALTGGRKPGRRQICIIRRGKK